jgi:hypothetical protein
MEWGYIQIFLLADNGAATALSKIMGEGKLIGIGYGLNN